MEQIDNKRATSLALHKDENIAKRQNAWASFAVALSALETELSVIESQANKGLVIAESKQDIIEAERSIQEATKAVSTIKEKRSVYTSKLAQISDKLRQPEKDLALAIAEAKVPLLKIKKAIEAENAKSQQEQQKMAQFKSDCNKAVIDANTKARQGIYEKVKFVYETALNSNLKPSAIDSFIDSAVAENLASLVVKVDRPKTDLDPDTASTIVKQSASILIQLPQLEIEFRDALRQRFADYEVALQNKEEALKKAEEEAKQAKDRESAAAQTSKAVEEVHSKVDVAIGKSPEEGKNLKHSYEIDMDESVESATAILGAFVANVDLCLPKLRVNKWFSFTPKQAGIALCKVKKDDPNFQPMGVIFKEVSKL